MDRHEHDEHIARLDAIDQRLQAIEQRLSSSP